MLVVAERVLHYAVAVLAAFFCALQLAGFQLWLLSPGDDGTVGMGISIMFLFILTAGALVPFALGSTIVRMLRGEGRGALWKQDAALVIAIGLSYGILAFFLRSSHLALRVTGGLLAAGVIIIELYPRKHRIWNMF